MTAFFDKARGRWRYDFELAGTRYARECVDSAGQPVTSKRAAQDCENEARRVARTASRLPRSADLTFAQVVNDLSDIWKNEPGWPDRQRKARELVQFFGAATAMRDIDGAQVQDYLAFAIRQPLKVWTGGPKREPEREDLWKPHPSGRTRSPATVNRSLPLLRAIFKRAYNTRDPITRERAIDEILAIEDLAELKRKARPVPDAVLTEVMDSQSPHVVEAIKLTLFFGLRKGEAFPLTIAHVDFQAGGLRLDAGDVKNKTDAFMPGSSHAMQFLAQLVDQARERNTPYLITWRGRFFKPEKLAAQKWRPIKSPKSAWRTAMNAIEKRYGKRWRWHDIRAAYITQVALTSGPIAAQSLARHQDFKTTQGYIEVADEVRRAAAELASERPAFGVVAGGKR